MTTETLFQVCNFGIMPAWLLLVLAPKWRFTQLIVHSLFIPIILGALYIGLLVSSAGSAGSGASMSTLEGAMQLLSSPKGFMAGWVHYIIFDLFVGAWIVRDAAAKNIRHLYIVPSLLLTLMLGPVGLLSYTIIRLATSRKIVVD